MRFLIDEQLPAALAGRLEAKGLEAIHVSTLLGYGAPDETVASEARKLQAVLMTKDADFVQMSAGGVLSCQIVWVRLGHMSNQALWTILLPVLPQILLELKRGERVVQLV